MRPDRSALFSPREVDALNVELARLAEHEEYLGVIQSLNNFVGTIRLNLDRDPAFFTDEAFEDLNETMLIALESAEGVSSKLNPSQRTLFLEIFRNDVKKAIEPILVDFKIPYITHSGELNTTYEAIRPYEILKLLLKAKDQIRARSNATEVETTTRQVENLINRSAVPIFRDQLESLKNREVRPSLGEARFEDSLFSQIKELASDPTVLLLLNNALLNAIARSAENGNVLTASVSEQLDKLVSQLSLLKLMSPDNNGILELYTFIQSIQSLNEKNRQTGDRASQAELNSRKRIIEGYSSDGLSLLAHLKTIQALERSGGINRLEDVDIERKIHTVEFLMRRLDEEKEYINSNTDDHWLLIEINKQMLIDYIDELTVKLAEAKSALLSATPDIASTPDSSPPEDVSKRNFRTLYEKFRETVPSGQMSLQLPEFDKISETDPVLMQELLMLVCIEKIYTYYGDVTASAGKVIAIHAPGLDIWKNNDLFIIDDADVAKIASLEALIEGISKLLIPNDSGTSQEVEVCRKHFVGNFKNKILHIQNSGNMAAGIDDLAKRHGLHGDFYKQLPSFFEGLGLGGGWQKWDTTPYRNRTHEGGLYEKLFGSKENWFMPAYEDYFLFVIKNKYSELVRNDFSKLEELTDDLMSDEPGTVLHSLKEHIDRNPGFFGPDRFKKDRTVIKLAAMKAAWNIIGTLTFLEMDKGAVYSKAARVFNPLKYLIKLIAVPNETDVRWRAAIASTFKALFMPTEVTQSVEIQLRKDGDDLFSQEYLDFESSDKIYKKWLNNLVKEGGYDPCVIASESEISELREYVRELSSFKASPTEITAKKNRQSALIKEIDEISTSERRRSKCISEVDALQEEIDLNKKFIYAEGMLTALESKQSSMSAVTNQKRRDEVLRHESRRFAIETRYLVVRPLIDSHSLRLSNHGLPIAIPKAYILEDDVDNVRAEVTVAEVKNAMLDSEAVLWETIDDDHNQKWASFAAELLQIFAQFEFGSGNIFTAISNSQLQKKVIYTEWLFHLKPSFTYLMLRIRGAVSGSYKGGRKLRDLGEGITNTRMRMTNSLSNRIPDSLPTFIPDSMRTRLIDPVKARISGFTPDSVKNLYASLISKLPDRTTLPKIAKSYLSRKKSRLETKIEKSVRKRESKVNQISLKFNKFVTKLISIDTIAEAELFAGIAENVENAGFKFDSKVKGAKYQVGKRTDHLAFIRMVVEYPNDLFDVIDRVSQSQLTEGKKKEILAAAMNTGANVHLREALDYCLSLNPPNFKRFEKQYMVVRMWNDTRAYLEQYRPTSREDELLEIPLLLSDQLKKAKDIKSKAGLKIMDAKDIELFLIYYQKLIDYFNDPTFAIGESKPLWIPTIGDVKEMLIQTGILGTNHNFLANILLYEEIKQSFGKSKVQKEKEKGK